MDAQCGKGWGDRCAAAKSKRCRCRCGGENHGGSRLRQEDDSPRRTPDEDLYYAWDERRQRRLLPGADKIRQVRFTRLAGKPSITPGIDQRGDALIELVYDDHSEVLRQRYMKHSHGMEFGYGGSGPADAALNILSAFVGPKNATELRYQDFKFTFVTTISQEAGGVVSGDDIRQWIQAGWDQLAEKEKSDALAVA